MGDTRFIHYPLNPPMSAKRGVEIDMLDLSIRNQLVRISYLWCAFFTPHEDVNGMTLTSTYEGYVGDGVHGEHSLHYKGCAVDLRTKDVSLTRIAPFIRALKELLGSDYDIVNEGDHIHVEYDPKRGPDSIVASEDTGPTATPAG